MTNRGGSTPGVKSLLATMRAHGAHTMLVSGGLRLFHLARGGSRRLPAERGNILLGDGHNLPGHAASPS